MPAINPQKLDLLEHFYDHLTEKDWLEGVDLYQAGKVEEVISYQNLLTGKVFQITGNFDEVRLKIHPSGRVIQWIECTCKKNRTYGAYCEHIAAFMIHVEREKSSFFNSLDIKAPLKPPVSPKRSLKQSSSLMGNQPESKAKTKASQTLLDHLKGSIQSVALAGNGPSIKVKIEIKPGTVTTYELDVDESAQFFLDNKNLVTKSTTLKGLIVLDLHAEIGSRISAQHPECLVAEKVIGIPLTNSAYSRPFFEKAKIKSYIGKYYKTSDSQKENTGSDYLFFPLKTASRYIGQKFFFIPGIGYCPIIGQSARAEWQDLPLSKSFKNDEAAKLVHENYREYLIYGTVWLEDGLEKPQIIDFPNLDSIRVHSVEDNGWFYLDPRYGMGDTSISMGELMIQYKQKKRKYVRKGNSWIKIPEFIIDHDWQLDSNNSLLKVDTLGLMRLKAAIGDFDHFVGSKATLNKIRNRVEFTKEITTPTLEHTKLTLRSYQQTGLDWFWWLYKNDLHGLLADDMGLGKTHQAMALMSAIQKDLLKENVVGKFLVICPTTVLDHWEDKINSFAPNLAPIKYHGPKRPHILNQLKTNKNTIITSYGVLLRDIKKLEEINWHAIILDEAHFVKNNNTATYRAACHLKSKIRLCLTGTPLENHLGELKNIFDFLVPGYLGSDEYFKKNFLSPIEQKKDVQQELALQRLIHPLKLRRTKSQVLSDLPAKVEDIRHCTLSDEQARMYRDIINIRAKPLIEQIANNNQPIPFLHVFTTLQLLKQICDHPALITPGSNYQNFVSGKFEVLKELLQEALDSNNKIVIFSQYLEMIKIIKHYCDSIHVKSVVMTGQSKNRGKIIETFQNDSQTKVFIGSLLAGGIGIDLTAASVVIHYDRWWNASKENQATDRVHRIGQKNFVQVFKLVTKGTLEEKIDLMISKKQSIFTKFLEKDEEVFKSLSRHDLLELLQY